MITARRGSKEAQEATCVRVRERGQVIHESEVVTRSGDVRNRRRRRLRGGLAARIAGPPQGRASCLLIAT